MNIQHRNTSYILPHTSLECVAVHFFVNITADHSADDKMLNYYQNIELSVLQFATY